MVMHVSQARNSKLRGVKCLVQAHTAGAEWRWGLNQGLSALSVPETVDSPALPHADGFSLHSVVLVTISSAHPEPVCSQVTFVP